MLDDDDETNIDRDPNNNNDDDDDVDDSLLSSSTIKPLDGILPDPTTTTTSSSSTSLYKRILYHNHHHHHNHHNRYPYDDYRYWPKRAGNGGNTDYSMKKWSTTTASTTTTSSKTNNEPVFSSSSSMLTSTTSTTLTSTNENSFKTNGNCESFENHSNSNDNLIKNTDDIIKKSNDIAAAAVAGPSSSSTTPITYTIPTVAEKEQFQRSLDSATTLVFHRRSGLPLNSSPAPIRKSGTCFDFDSSLTSVNAIKKALFHKDPDGKDDDYHHPNLRSSKLSLSAPTTTTTSGLLGNFEESVLNGRLDPASIVHGFSAEIGASGGFCPSHKTFPVTVFFYTLQDTDKGEKMSSPYLGHINLGEKGYHVPRQGTVQVTLFNPNGTVVKMFVVRYDLSDMPPNCRTFLRQRTLFMPNDANEHHPDSRKWLRYLIHLRFQSSKSGRIRLHTDIRILVFRKHDLDVATMNGGAPYELRSFVQMPSNPKYSKNIKT
uniref:Protein FAM214A-like n=1 Tax=Dermatophagoides pteronyssinus TaxID=6956 RepID=A0A6P6XR84_DERPT|nr:protein FAM214A-like [Dermatophagoides pteronyssinus]